MATFERFEDIEAWQVARDIGKMLHELTQRQPLSREFKLRDQMNGAAGSIMDNIAEGFGRGGNAEFAQFLAVSLGSANEVQSQVYRCLDKQYISGEEFQAIFKLLEKVRSKLIKLIQYLKDSEIKGPKFRKL